jgi:hypothetical protein
MWVLGRRDICDKLLLLRVQMSPILVGNTNFASIVKEPTISTGHLCMD